MTDREFILDEDRALRNLLVGITVSDQKDSARRVGVWFGQPDIEIRDQSYPFITVDLIDIGEAKDRAHRGRSAPEYDRPSNATPGRWEIDFPIPVNLDYQITTWARQPRHDRQILTSLLAERAPLRFGVLCPDDNTVRSLDVLEVVKRDTTEAGKRLFRNVITVRVYSELPPSVINTYQPVTDRLITFGFTTSAQPGIS